MAEAPLATKGNYLHIYDFRVKPGMAEKFIELFSDFDYSEGNPAHKSPAQVKDGVLCRKVDDPDRFYLIAEWADIEAHAAILKQLMEMDLEFVPLIEDLDKGAFVPAYAKVVNATEQEVLDKAAKG